MPEALTRRTFLLGLYDGAEGVLLRESALAEAYRHAASRNVLAAVNPRVFPGYWSVCADGRGFGYGNTYPSLDGHQMTDALLWLGQVETVRQNFDYVRRFQREDGSLPLAILPASAGKNIGPPGYPGTVAENGGLYRHWVPGNPLAALASPTYIQNADVIFRRTLDREWLAAQMASVNRAAEFLAGLTGENGAVRGGGYYIERPVRLECDGVTQPHAVDAFRRVAALNRVLGDAGRAGRYDKLAARVRHHFVTRFWVKDHFAEYLHPRHGLIDRHGLTDSNWAALAFGVPTARQQRLLWRRLKDAQGFYYGGMPTAIATDPASYEGWEFSYPDRMDLAAMGRVWYLEAAARARLGDAAGLLDSIARVCRTGRAGGYFWRERYGSQGGYGAEKYCEYPANLIRIVQRFLFGVGFQLDGTVVLAPAATREFREHGFGQTLEWRGRLLEYRIRRDGASGTYAGDGPQRLELRVPGGRPASAMLPASSRPRPWSIGMGA